MKNFALLSALCVAGVQLAGAQAAPAYWLYNSDFTVPGGFQSVAHGGSANQAGNTITRMIMDDVNVLQGYSAQNFYRIRFMMVNPGATVVSCRPRMRYWKADNATLGPTGVGNPGTYYNAAAGFTFNPIAVPAATSYLITGTIGAGFTPPTATMWVGMTFDDSTGATLATLAEMDQMATGIAQPAIGTSTDAMFQTTAAGSFFNTATPPGAQFQFPANTPVANAACSLGVQGQYYNLSVSLNDTSAAMAVQRDISYVVTSGTTSITSGVLNFTSPSVVTTDPSLDSPFLPAQANRNIVVPAIGPGGSTSMTITLDGGPYLKRVVNFTLPTPSPASSSPAISLPVISMQNGDVDSSTEVDAADIDAVIADYGSVYPGGPNANADVDDSGEVDAADIDIVIANYGGTDN